MQVQVEDGITGPEKPGGAAPAVKVEELSTGGVQIIPEDTNGEAPKAPAGDKKQEELIGGKFKSQDDLLKAYNELQAKLGSRQPEPGGETPAPVDAATAQAQLADKGFDLSSLSDEFTANNGKLTEESLKALEAKGITRETVDAYVAGAQALAEKALSELADAAGGVEQFGKMREWAKTNLTEAQAKAFNKAVASGDSEMARLAVQGLASRYSQAMGSEPALVDGERIPGTSGIEPFRSTAEVMAAMSDKRYKTGDEAYIADVIKRLAVSKVFT